MKKFKILPVVIVFAFLVSTSVTEGAWRLKWPQLPTFGKSEPKPHYAVSQAGYQSPIDPAGESSMFSVPKLPTLPMPTLPKLSMPTIPVPSLPKLPPMPKLPTVPLPKMPSVSLPKLPTWGSPGKTSGNSWYSPAPKRKPQSVHEWIGQGKSPGF